MLTMTEFDPTVGAFTLLPPTDPTTGIVTFTPRPARDGRDKALLHAMLGGFGVDPDVNGTNLRSVDEDLKHIKARIRAYEVKALVVRQAVYAPTTSLDLLRQLAVKEGLHLALTCDEGSGVALGEWVDEHGGTINKDANTLRSQLAAVARPGLTLPDDSHDIAFPHLLPETGWYNFRSRCKYLLTPAEFALVDDLYVEVATTVHAQPFTSPKDAADRIHDWYEQHPYPGQLRTIVRAAEAAMFKHGQALKTNEVRLMATVEREEHRRLSPAELRSLRAYYQTWRSATRALRDAGLAVQDIKNLVIGEVTPNGTLKHNAARQPVHLTPEAALILAAHRHFRRLRTHDPDAPLVTQGIAYLSTALRESSADLNLPSLPNYETRITDDNTRWASNLGVTLDALAGAHGWLADHAFKGAPV